MFANGDIDSPEKARAVLEHTRADALMIGRAAQGRPWVFREIAHYLRSGEKLAPPSTHEVRRWLLQHLDELYEFYGEGRGLRVARKHIQWYCQDHPGSEAFWASINRVTDAAEQRRRVAEFFDTQPQSLAA